MGRAEREERLVAIVRQARLASRLVDDLLLMTRLDAGPRPRSTADLVAVVREQLTTVSLRRPDVAVRLVGTSGPVPVAADLDGLRRAVANLLANAADASPPDGEVVVDIRIDPEPQQSTGGEVVRVSVLDQGAGVPVVDRDRIFDRFVRLTPDRGGGGSGLGLPIARAVARRDGGDVVCLQRTDRPGGRFDLTLPAAGRIDPPDSHSAAPGRAPTRRIDPAAEPSLVRE